MTEKPTAIILPSWNPDDPRFVVKNCKHRIAEDREFRNNTCVFNQRLGFAYNVNEIVEVLNSMGDKLDKLEKENEQLRQSRDYWCKSAKLHSKYFNCLEKAIERAYEEKPNPTDEDINRIYAELEKEIDDD